MNPVIRKIGEQCGLYMEPHYSGGFPNDSLVVVEDFAKGIIDEVISVLEKRYMGDLNREDMEVLRCVADIKRHFGV
jgi:hypothetical protein